MLVECTGDMDITTFVGGKQFILIVKKKFHTFRVCEPVVQHQLLAVTTIISDIWHRR